MIDVYEIRFQDGDNCIVKICQEDEHGNEITGSLVCLRYKEAWESALLEHVTNFFNKHGETKAFEETKDIARLITVYNFVTNDNSRLTIDAIDKVQAMEEIKKAKKHL